MRAAIALAGAALALAIGAAPGSAGPPSSVTVSMHGLLVGVAADQRSLQVEYTNLEVPECSGIVAVTPTVTETATDVTVALAATVTLPPSNVACAMVELRWTIAVPLSHPLAGREIHGLPIQGGAFADPSTYTTMTNLVGLSPRDARLMLSPAPGGFHTVGLVDHYDAHQRGVTLPVVVGQFPKPGAHIVPGKTIVGLKVAR